MLFCSVVQLTALLLSGAVAAPPDSLLLPLLKILRLVVATPPVAEAGRKLRADLVVLLLYSGGECTGSQPAALAVPCALIIPQALEGRSLLTGARSNPLPGRAAHAPGVLQPLHRLPR